MAIAVEQSAGLFEEHLADFILIRTDEVDEGDRLRPVDPIWAEALGQIMRREGQRTPVEVCRLPGRSRWTLVAGGHRLAGARSADIEFLRAEVVGADRDERRSREVSENLWRDDLLPLDRAAFIAEAVAIQKRRAGIDPSKDGRAISAAVRWQKQVADEAEDATATLAVAYDLSAELAEAIGLSARTIRDDLMLHRRLPASLAAQLREANHPILASFGQLRALAKLDQGAQRRAVDALIAGAKSVAEATRDDTTRPADPEAKRQSTIIGTLKRMSAGERLALFQSPIFHAAIPADARALLAPMLRTLEGENGGVGNAVLASQAGAADKPGKVDLHEVITFIEEKQLDEHDPDWIVAETAKRFNGIARYTNGAYELRVGGIVGTCTSGGTPQLSSWKRAARKRLLGLERAA